MIKKITNQNQIARHKLAEKINELVDAVNGILAIQEQYETIYNEDIVPMLTPQNEAPDGDDAIQEVIHADPYAEQRKWIGKLCRCWDSNINDDVWGILQDIKDNKTEKYYLYGIGYEHCEPVKPDDDIIFNGE